MGENKSRCMTLTELFSKEVVNTGTGERLGFINDAEIDAERGIIKCFFVPEKCKNPFSRKRNVTKFTVNDIVKIGCDIILIRFCPPAPPCRNDKCEPQRQNNHR